MVCTILSSQGLTIVGRPRRVRRLAGTASEGLGVCTIWVDYGQVYLEIPPPVSRFHQDVPKPTAFPGNVHFAVIWDLGWGKDLAETWLSLRAKVPLPHSRFVTQHGIFFRNFRVCHLTPPP